MFKKWLLYHSGLNELKPGLQLGMNELMIYIRNIGDENISII